MKKIVSLSLATLFLVAATSCGTDAATNDTNPATASASTPNTSVSDISASTVSSTPEKDTSVSAAPYEITYSNFTTFTDSIGTVWGQVIIEITNTGSNDLYLRSGSYDIKDNNNSLVATESLVSVYPDVLQPGEKGYLYDENTFDDLSTDEAYSVTPHLSIDNATIPCVRYDVFDTTLKEDDWGDLSLIGQVTNTSDEEGSLVYVVAILYDDNNAPIGILYTILTDDLPAGETVGFEATALSLPPSVSADTVADTVIYAFPTQMQF